MSNFSEIVKRTPINRASASIKGEHYSAPTKHVKIRTDVCPRLTTRKHHKEVNDLTGNIFGRLTVVGRLDHPKNLRWVVKCSCGYYERRRTTALTNAAPEKLMCSSCELLEERKSGRGWWQGNTKKTLRKDLERPKNRFYKKSKIPSDIRWKVWERDNFTCLHCGSRQNLSIDHVTPEVEGGPTVIENLQTLCRRCNSKKGCRNDAIE